MFHPLFSGLIFGTHDCMADAFALVSAFKVEQDLQRTWREDREREILAEAERDVSTAEDWRFR